MLNWQAKVKKTTCTGILEGTPDNSAAAKRKRPVPVVVFLCILMAGLGMPKPVCQHPI